MQTKHWINIFITDDRTGKGILEKQNFSAWLNYWEYEVKQNMEPDGLISWILHTSIELEYMRVLYREKIYMVYIYISLHKSTKYLPTLSPPRKPLKNHCLTPFAPNKKQPSALECTVHEKTIMAYYVSLSTFSYSH